MKAPRTSPKTLAEQRFTSDGQRASQPNNYHTSAPVTFDQLSDVLSACSTVPYHCHPRMRGSHRTQASD